MIKRIIKKYLLQGDYIVGPLLLLELQILHTVRVTASWTIEKIKKDWREGNYIQKIYKNKSKWMSKLNKLELYGLI